MPSDRYDCGNIDFCNDGDKLHSIKTLEDFMVCRILQIQKENTQGQYMVS